ncbi:hypothetical protein A2642_03420 [Candidatus Nomurabacteria bacterium RIFCSPHIGHO2_01_FULL_39_10]|uniref:Addiction module toxin RelE n=1 Tax=Candidatus Nomurabacteria bacterium RIFCSPHIGHO2_01_FULL_39_10 TaxID=1801733 RepID=A0A1F6V9A6_9BACT|nr:MAG: hypothetical protein A2642_03420 [Candidatus Nomurabacteria bacterium RIFCSPHIGHO2_01_FULL_39_10]
MTFAVYHTSTFDKELEKMPKDFQEWVDKIEDQLVLNPYVGDQIRVRWCREKKKDKYRLYYLIYDDLKAVYVIALSEKKDQQAVINTIFLLLDQYKEQIQCLLKT